MDWRQPNFCVGQSLEHNGNCMRTLWQLYLNNMKTIWDLYKNNMRVETWIFFCRSSSWMLWELGQAGGSSQSDYSPESTNQSISGKYICDLILFCLDKFLFWYNEDLCPHFWFRNGIKEFYAWSHCNIITLKMVFGALQKSLFLKVFIGQ